MKTRLVAVLFGFALGVAPTASASPITYHLADIFFEDGAIATGSFVFEELAGPTATPIFSYSDVSVNVTDPDGSVYHYASLFGFGGHDAVLRNGLSGRHLYFEFGPSISATPERIGLERQTFEYIDDFTDRSIVPGTGYLTTTAPKPTSVPEPSSLLLTSIALLMGIGGSCVRTRRTNV